MKKIICNNYNQLQFYSNIIRSHDYLYIKSSTPARKPNWISILDYTQFTLSKYDFNNTRFAGLEVGEMEKVGFMSSTRNLLV
jgi:hypothetical protein